VEETEGGRRGVKTRLFGFTLMILGVLDSLLTLRGGIPAYEFLFLILLGACVFAIGAVRGRQHPAKPPDGVS
jgi:Na+-transporting methylmalonyl-CoA/oxaloacetate decarboxylase gamma subunit